VDIVFTSCVVHCYVKAFRWVGKCNLGVMGRPEDEGGELGSRTNPAESRDSEQTVHYICDSNGNASCVVRCLCLCLC